MNSPLILWSLIASIIFTVLYLAFGGVILFYYKLRIAKTQRIIIILSLSNMVAKNVGFGIIYYFVLTNLNDKSIQDGIVNCFSIITSTCFLASF